MAFQSTGFCESAVKFFGFTFTRTAYDTPVADSVRRKRLYCSLTESCGQNPVEKFLWQVGRGGGVAKGIRISL